MRHIRTTGWMFDTSNSTSHVTIPVAAMHFCYYYSSPAVTGLMMIVIIEYIFAGSLNCKARNRISCTALMIVMKRMPPYVPHGGPESASTSVVPSSFRSASDDLECSLQLCCKREWSKGFVDTIL